MPSHSSEKVWFITGAATGLGRALADHVLAQGDRVIATARRSDRLADIENAGPDHARTFELDVTNSGEVNEVVAAAWEAFGRVDYVVNNAGSAYRAPLEACTDDDIRGLFETNFFSAVSVIQAFIPRLRAQQSGHFVNVSSLAGGAPAPGRSVYAASKSALEGLSATLAQELEMFGVGVTIVQPGGFVTQLMERAPTLPVIDAYGPLYEVMNGPLTSAAPSEPALGAEAMYAALTSPEPPLYFPLRASCRDYIRRALEEQLYEYEAWDSTIRMADPL
jgi:NAD(P)-dependent dehydrogenase (short-subunit alcohol dehydrogenase family)